MKKKIVIALGGNALGNSPEEQLRLVQKTAKYIVDLADTYDIVVTHGNGPQVGAQLLRSERAADQVPVQPLDVCGAASQGEIGYLLSQSLRDELHAAGLDVPVVSVVGISSAAKVWLR